uniref:Uncharacterized protein n=1 Tax=Timema bartmani TaxID=61472 RepID=A0A7R9F466_9NEOP|nr:unnamed protein product [Timema bartmani]
MPPKRKANVWAGQRRVAVPIQLHRCGALKRRQEERNLDNLMCHLISWLYTGMLCEEGKVALCVSHSSLMSFDRMKLRLGYWAVMIDSLEEAAITSLSSGSSVKDGQHVDSNLPVES